MKSHELYNGQVNLQFDAGKHVYYKDSQKVPNVTTILSVINKPALINWASNMAVDTIQGAIKAGETYDEVQLSALFASARKSHLAKKKEAGDVGSMVHQWIEQYVKGQEPDMPVNQVLNSSASRFLEWQDKHRVTFQVSEQVVYSANHNFVGTLDLICFIDGQRYVADIKTSSGIYPEYLLQTSAYRCAREEEHPEEEYAGQLIIRIGRDGAFEFARIDNRDYPQLLAGFLSVLDTWRTMEDLKSYKPELI